MTNFGWEYVWHCHLLGHEENDMMRPMVFMAGAGTTYIIPPAPTGVVATGGNAQATVTFPALPANGRGPITGYIVTAIPATPGASLGVDSTVSAISRTRTITGLTNYVAYTFTVAAKTAAGTGLTSNPSNSIVVAPPPAAPTNLVATLQAGPQVSLTWTDNATTETNFIVERAANGGTFAQIATLGPSAGSGLTVTYVDPNTSVALGNSYIYRVKDVNVISIGTISSAYVTTGTIDVNVPTTPTNLTAAIATSTHISLSWTDASNNETSFAIWRSIDGAAATQAGTVTRTGTQITGTGSAVTFTDTGLASGHTYVYYVTAVNVLGPSPASNTATVTAPVAPINLTAVIATSTHINLSWTDNSNNETSFAIWRSVNSAAATQVGTVTRTGTQITSTGGTAVTFTNTGLTAGNTYAYYVTAVNIVGPSSASNTATVSFTAPAAPTSLGVAAVIANVSNDTVTLTWVNPAGNNQTSYSIQRATNSGFTGATTSTATGTALTLNQTVGRSATLYYRIRAVNAVGVSAYTNATPLPIVTP
jgi:titin